MEKLAESQPVDTGESFTFSLVSGIFENLKTPPRHVLIYQCFKLQQILES